MSKNKYNIQTECPYCHSPIIISYQKYKPFVDKCNRNIDIGHVSGYRGAKDYEKLQIADLFEIVDSTFPYGWKQFVNFID